MSRSSAEPPASLASLPTEIADTIYYSLGPATLAVLARVSKDIYAAVQGPLYRRPILNSYRKLQLFVQTLNKVASWDTSSGDARSKRIVHLTLLIDPAREQTGGGRPLIAVLLARLVRVIARYGIYNSVYAKKHKRKRNLKKDWLLRYNPRVTITLVISHSSCESQPVQSFGSETFPRITTLILGLGTEPAIQPSQGGSSSRAGVGSSSLDTVIPIRRHLAARHYNNSTTLSRCRPNSKFWTRFFNGTNFPDLQRLELHHRSRNRNSYGAYEGWETEPILFTDIDTMGLAKIERLVVDCVPEFNDAVLMAGLRNAPLLTDLQIGDCYVTYEALDKLLIHALPVLHRLVLRIPQTSHHAAQVRQNVNARKPPRENPHLCPHFRRGGNNLKHFEFTAPFICRDLFLDEYEKEKLRESGHPGTLVGDAAGDITQGELDIMLVTGILKGLRRHRETDSGARIKVESTSFEDDKKLLEKERLRRNRRATIDKEKWTRKLNVLEGMCFDGDTFDELVALAEVEEQGIAWVLGHKPGNKASKVNSGLVHPAVYDREFETDESPGQHRRTVEHDFNDDLVGN
ncbi:hypothetical protein ABW20_dc0101485 [Dactylellina cionopaga]|nr:hypothetical protein ABW20_dc0101485 [Dactylellina cionopaga]